MDTTSFLAQFLGLFLVVITVSLIIRRDTIRGLIDDIEHSHAALYALSVFGLGAGLILVLVHNDWNGSFLSLIVTVISWLILLKSVLFLVLAPKDSHKLIRMFRSPSVYTVWLIVALAFGIYLTYAGLGGM